jgi:phage shock protein A
VLGVNAAISSVHRKQYLEARVAAVYLLGNGTAINRSMERLHEVNVRDYNLVKGAQSALEAGDTSLFNRQLAQAEVYGGEQRSLQDQVQSYKTEFDKALKR